MCGKKNELARLGDGVPPRKLRRNEVKDKPFGQASPTQGLHSVTKKLGLKPRPSRTALINYQLLLSVFLNFLALCSL